MEESPYLESTLATIGSALDRASLISMYDDYLRPRQWTRLNIDENEVVWEKAGVRIEFWAAQPDEIRVFQTKSQKGYPTWYRLLIAETKAKSLNPCTQPKR